MHEEIAHFYLDIAREFPENQLRLEIYPSGAAFLDVKVGGETYVMEYHVGFGIGVSRMSTAVYGWEGYEHPFGDFVSAKDFLLGLLKAGAQADRINHQPAVNAKLDHRRMCPPVSDSIKTLPDGTIRAESRGHFSYYLRNGGIQIVEKASGTPIFEK